MIFIESYLFTKQLPDYLEDEEYQKFQNFLIETPDAGDVIQGAGGLRKLRWALANKGKRSGARIIYYWQATKDQIFLFTLYAKNEVTDLTAAEKRALKQMLEDWQ